MGLIRDWQQRRHHQQADGAAGEWLAAEAALPILEGLTSEERARLRELAVRFLRRKTIETVQGLTLDPAQRRLLVLQACLPILELGLDWYDGWHALIIYPGQFISRQEVEDDIGLVHEIAEARSGESWHRGPVILSLEDIAHSGQCEGYNVIIHELAHKLDMRNGSTNGYPPLHAGMSVADWSRTMQAAYDDLNARLDRGEETAIDPYAAEGPGEFFAVVSEYFFELSHLLRAEYPEVYRQLALFYRQDPARRLPENP